MDIILALILAATAVFIIVFLKSDSKYTESLFVYKNNIYIYKDQCKYKDSYTGIWKDAVIYQSCKDDKIYVRDLEDFIDNFETYEQWQENLPN